MAFVFGIGVICCGYMIPNKKETDFLPHPPCGKTHTYIFIGIYLFIYIHIPHSYFAILINTAEIPPSMHPCPCSKPFGVKMFAGRRLHQDETS